MVQIQKTEKKEETEFKVVHEKTISPCINNCGNVAGNPATNNMCQTCFSAAVSSAAPKFSGDEATSRSTPSRSPKRSHPYGEETEVDRRSLTADRSEVPEAATAEKKRAVNRCSGCRKKVGLTGFRCRCGDLFCAEHRYSDRHDCSYDYKAVGREAIARENPVVKAAKIVKV